MSAVETPDFDNTEIAFAWLSTPRLYESYLVFKALGSNSFVKFSTGAITTALKLNLPVTPLIRHTVFKQFCGGTSLEDCLTLAKKMEAFGVKSILDYSVEACTEEEDLDEVAREITRTIDFAAKQTAIAMSVFKTTGLIRFDLLEKLSLKKPLSALEQTEWQRGQERVRSICKRAYDLKVPILIDAEETWIQDAVDELAFDMMSVFNKERCIVYNTLQMYRWDRLDYLKAVHARAKNAKIIYGAKLVRGAYMEKERARAKAMQYPDPIQANKKSTDRDFNTAMYYCVEHRDDISLFAGTHNEESTSALTRFVLQKGLATNDPRVHFSQLYGMSDNLSYNLAKHGFNVSKYVPYGPVKSVLPYLFRRAEENTSIQGQAGRELKLISKELSRRGKG